MVVNESEYSIPQYPQVRRYVKPSIELLDNIPVSTSATQEDIWANAALLEQALAEFRIDAKVQNIVRGPAVTRYELSLAPGISIKKIMVLTDDIARRMSVDAVRIEPTISGKDLFGIEVPNKKRDIVSLRSIIQSEEFMAPSQGLKFSLGMDIGGRIITPDITEMPHLLIAGSTGTGKSVCLNSIIISLMYKYSPDELRFILIDPKRVEFSQYRNMPHLMINEVVTDIEKTISVFNWAIDEMKRRYNLFAEAGNVKKLSEYNNAIDLSRAKKLPRIVIVVDELSDLIMYNKSEIEARIQALSALARAAGIHLILATQRPSVDIITGVIKANLPSRVAFKVTSMADSKTILDQGGPEKLLGKGDMLFITDNMPKPVRLQGSYVSTEEVSRVVSFIKQNNECDFDDEAADRIMREKNGVQIEGEIVDSLYMDILDFIVTTKEASISKVQRHFRIGFNRAGKIIEDMERRGFIGENNGSKSREVFITREEFERLKAENE
jgi:S-DNA-T family DNA segregation ATPase FtsK/SpoIIIE